MLIESVRVLADGRVSRPAERSQGLEAPFSHQPAGGDSSYRSNSLGLVSDAKMAAVEKQAGQAARMEACKKSGSGDWPVGARGRGLEAGESVES